MSVSADVVYRGQPLRSVKRRFPGTERTVPPEDTLERIRPILPRLGITRLANITGLDRIGIPVTLAIRPNGKVLSVSSGKGLTLGASLISGAMEALELQHAEYLWDPPTVRRSYEEMRCESTVPDQDELPLALAAPFPRDWPYRWTHGWDLIGQCEVALPVSMIHMGNRDTRLSDLFSFQITSNGLASGNTLLEAVHSALLEVVERDAATCHVERWHVTGTPPPVVDLERVDYPLVRQLMDRLTAARVHAVLFDCTVDTNVPVYMANIFDLSGGVSGTFRGYGANLDPEIAMTRALSEAVQARVVTVAGSRDDLYRHREAHRRSIDRQLWRLEELRPGVAPTAPERRSRAAATFEQDTALLLSDLLRSGMRRVVVFDLSVAWCPVAVVKVIVPGLEGYRAENYAPGRRALAFASADVTDSRPRG